MVERAFQKEPRARKAKVITTEEAVVMELTLTVKVMKPLMTKALCSKRETDLGI